ncbi:MAG: ATPase [Epulopiscium sp.]|jgi:vacuolar-type H+-ATPase subunit H|nr:ATPase [Candidatus Epulonipiscium sp.]
METVLQLLDELEEILDNSRAVPFSNKVSVDKEEIYDIIGEIRLKLPNELKQSKWVIEERNKILIDAQKEADEIVKNAEVRMSRMVDESEVTRQAYEQAALIIESAKKTSKEMRLGAMEYAEGILASAESKLRELKNVVYNESIKTDDYFSETLNVLAENIQELKMGK